MSKLPPESLATSLKEIELHGMPVKTVLGVEWDPEKDVFVVKVNVKTKPCNRHS